MSLIFYDQTPHLATIVTDTLASDADGNPCFFSSKVDTFPHLNMVVAVTGLVGIADRWRHHIASSVGTEDIEHINAFAPTVLRAIQAEIEERNRPTEGTRIFHFGFPAGSDRIVRYTYESADGYEPERVETEGQFWVQPSPLTFKSWHAQHPEEFVELATRIREENQVAIGGDLHVTLLRNWNIQTMRFHRFPDYDATREAMILHRAALIRDQNTDHPEEGVNV